MDCCPGRVAAVPSDGEFPARAPNPVCNGPVGVLDPFEEK